MTSRPIELIETMRVAAGNTVPLLAGHRQRLKQSCVELTFTWPGDAVVDKAIDERVRSLDSQQTHRLRLLLNPAGRLSLETNALPPTTTPVLIRLSAAPLDTDPFWSRHKTTHRPWFADAHDWLTRNPDFFDVIFCNPQDQACEGSRSNVYILNPEGAWLTPPLGNGVLPGVQRQALLDAGRVREAPITRAALTGAAALRVSNALRGWLPAKFSSASTLIENGR